MTAPAPKPAFDAAMRRRMFAAGAAVFAERAIPHELGILLTLWSVYVAAALLGAGARLPGEARLAVLALLIVASAGLAARAAWRLGLPSRAARLARLERGGGLPRGQLALYEERPAGDPDAFGAVLWTRAQAAAAAARPRLGRPEWRPAPAIRYGLLPLLGTALFLGLVAAKDDAARRLAAAFSPYATTLAGVRVTINIESPDYAGVPARRVTIAGGGRSAAETLGGSRASFRVEASEPGWHVRAPDGRTYPAANGSAAVPLKRGGVYAVKAGGRLLAALDVTEIADGVPVIRFDGALAETPGGALRIGYRLTDDHGVSALSLRLRRGDDERSVDLRASARRGRGQVFADLTPHPFAGDEVDMRLVATDGAGQSGMSPPVRVKLPERRFVHPLATAIIAVRKALLGGADRVAVIRRLSAMASDPRRFDNDMAIYAGLRAAGWRLVRDRRPAARESVSALLWDIAVDLEDGGASRAMDDLRTAMERLSEGLGSDDDRALAAMADRLEAAMSDYLRRQIEAALADGSTGNDAGGAGGTVDLGFLDQMFDDLKDRIAAGDKAGAAAALANLRQLMETIRFGSAGSDAQAQARAARAAELARELRELETQQGGLRDETIANMIRSAFGERGALREVAAAQRNLRQASEDLRGAFGAAGIDAPAGLDAAAAAMAEAAAALTRGAAGDAIRAQTRALEALQQAANAAEAGAQRMAQMAGAGAMRPGVAGSGLDPLGRLGTGFGQGAVTLPDAAEVRRIQAIRKNLEERANDPSRSADERGYYLRLLKRF